MAHKSLMMGLCIRGYTTRIDNNHNAAAATFLRSSNARRETLDRLYETGSEPHKVRHPSVVRVASKALPKERRLALA